MTKTCIVPVLTLLLLLLGGLTDSHGFAHLRTESGAAFFWPSAEVTLNLRVGCPSSGSLTAWGPCWDDAAGDAATRWNAAGAQFKFVIRRTSVSASLCADDGLNTVDWASTQCGMPLGLDALAVTISWFTPSGEVADSDVVFNTNFDWNAYAGPQRRSAFDFHRVALHEFGHVLGLDHPDEYGQVVSAIMNSRADDLDRLQADDIAGIRAIYGVGAGGQNGHADYCRDYGPCSVGEGDCDGNSQCQSGLQCSQDVGASYGFRADYDVCEAASGGGTNGHADYCRDYGPCSVGEGDCDGNSQCQSGLQCSQDVGASYGFRADYDVCEAASGGGQNGHADYCRDYGPCSAGQGDCDGNSQCQSGLQCSQDVGASYGFAANYDVCEAASGGGQNGHADYCRDYGPCSVGEGDCDGNSQCQSGLQCRQDVGASYGFRANYDVCEAASGGGQNGHVDYCRDYGPCSVGEGDCDGSGECQSGLQCRQDVGASYGFRANYDVCEVGSGGGQNGHVDYCRDYGPCSVGQGDCDSSSECQSGLQCSRDVGASYGFPANYDVCE